MIKNIIIFGSTGMLGNYIYNFFYKKQNYNVIKSEFFISEKNINNLEDYLLKYNINNETCIINCIGKIPQRKNINSSDKEYFLINSIFPYLLSNICQKYDTKMIQPTTDCVFSGKRGNYIETDIHDETNNYGLSKSLGEPLNCTVIRTSIIGLEKYNKKSFMEWVINSLKNKETIKGFSNHYWNGITCLEYCYLIENIIINNNFWKGIQHIYSPTTKTKYELTLIIAKVFDLDTNNIIPNETENKVDKTLSSTNIFPFKIKELEEQIEELKFFNII